MKKRKEKKRNQKHIKKWKKMVTICAGK